MGVVAILCPRTGIKIPTGVETDAVGFRTMPDARRKVTCWACGGEHTWTKRWAILVADEPETPLVHNDRR